MPKSEGPNVRQRRVARRLRQWRKSKNMTLDDVRRQLRWSESKLSRFERAEINAGPAEIIALATIYGMDEETRDNTVRLAVDAIQNEDRWGRFSADSLRGDFKDFVEDEAEATEIRNVETVLISGLLQTSAYAEALLRGWEREASDAVISERRELRQQRQNRLDDPDGPLPLHAILHEPALHLPIGGPDVMREQLDHLLIRAERPTITIQVMPFSAGAFPGIGTAYHLINFERDQVGAVYLEGLQDGLYVEEETDIEAYTLNFERLQALALSPEESAERIAEIKKKTWTKE